MPAIAAQIPISAPGPFDNAAEWLHSLGDVPPHRIIFNPSPGTATESDLLRFVERDKRLCELIDGTLVEKTVGYWEAIVAMNLATRLTIYTDEHNLGAVSGADSTMRMKSGNVRLPDVSFVSLARLPKTLDPIPTLSPDLAVEVLSESNTAREMDQKLIEYFESGTRLVWIIDPPTRTVAIYHKAGLPTRTLNETDLLDGEDVVPGFTVAIADLFRNVPKKV
jgi:Uma2 family endonuclease